MSLPTPSLTATIVNGAVMIHGSRPISRSRRACDAGGAWALYSAKPRFMQACSECGQSGHNARTCLVRRRR